MDRSVPHWFKYPTVIGILGRLFHIGKPFVEKGYLQEVSQCYRDISWKNPYDELRQEISQNLWVIFYLKKNSLEKAVFCRK